METEDSMEESKAFIIRCRDGDVSVTDDQAARMFACCQYFHNAFRHGMLESTQGNVLTKPDWSVHIAGEIVRLLTGTTIGVPIGSIWGHEIFQAIDQIQPTIAFHNDQGQLLSPVDAQAVITALATVELRGLELSCRLDAGKWRSLAEKGVLFWLQEECPGVYLSATLPTPLRVRYDGSERLYSVLSYYDMEETVPTIFEVFGEGCSNKTPNEATLSIKFRNPTKALEFIRLNSDEPAPSEDNMRRLVFGGSFEALYNFLRIFQENAIQCLDLTVTNPDKSTLHQLMAASRCCMRGSSSLGIGAEACAIHFRKKCCRDIKSVLEFVLGRHEEMIVWDRTDLEQPSDTGPNKRSRVYIVCI